MLEFDHFLRILNSGGRRAGCETRMIVKKPNDRISTLSGDKALGSVESLGKASG